mgnify:FL=1
MKKVISLAMLGLISLGFSKTFYADNQNHFNICIAPNTTFSIDVPCKIKSVSYSNNVKGSIAHGSPHTGFFMVIQDKEKKKFYKNTASIVLACQNQSFSFLANIDKSCKDNHFSIILPKKVSKSDFNKQDILNISSGIMRAMLKGEVPFGFRRERVDISQNLYNNDIVMHIYYAYVGSNYVGFQGYITNKSKYVAYDLNIPLLMQRGWVLLYIGSTNFDTDTIIKPQETLPFDVVAIKENQKTLPYIKE